MSDVQATPAAVAVPATETVPTPTTETKPAIAAADHAPGAAKADTPVVAQPSTTAHPTAVAAAQAAPVAAAADLAGKPVEPVDEGLLGYKAPGLLKGFMFSERDFWFSDEPVAPGYLEHYLRSDKAEVTHPVVAWAGQTGKGLLFYVKKGDDKAHPAGVLPIFLAHDLEKDGHKEFSFRLHGKKHTFKAADEVERDSWFQQIEKSIEHGKAAHEDVVTSEAHIDALDKLAAAGTTLTPGGVVVPVTATHPRRSHEFDPVPVADPVSGEEYKENKRPGLLARLSSITGRNSSLSGDGSSSRKMSAVPAIAESSGEKPSEIETSEKPSEIETTAVNAVVGIDEKPKPTKRNSIFGSLKANLGGKSPVKEKELQDAELKSDAAPQLSQTTATNDVAAPPVAAAPGVESSTVGASEESPSGSKRGSIFGGLGRRASKMMSRSSSNKGESLTTGETAATSTDAAHPVTADLAAHEATEPVIAESTTTTGAATGGETITKTA